MFIYRAGGGAQSVALSQSRAGADRRRREEGVGVWERTWGVGVGVSVGVGCSTLSMLQCCTLAAAHNRTEHHPEKTGAWGLPTPRARASFLCKAAPGLAGTRRSRKQQAASSKQNSMQQPQVAFGTATVPGRGSMALAPGYATPGGCPQQCRYRPRYIVRYKLRYMQPYNGTSIWHGPRGRLTSVKY